jgi:hypothetical protein
MTKVEFYANKPIKMVKDAEELIRPFGPLYNSDRDFLTFELSFFYFFIYDYMMFSQLDNEIRPKILDLFLEKIQSSKPNDFPDMKELDKFYERRIFTYFTIKQNIQNMGEFSERCAEYINILLSYSETKNVYTCHNFDQAEKELRPHIEQDKYTDELKVLLSLSSSPLLINGIDPTEYKKESSSKNWFSKLFKKNR